MSRYSPRTLIQQPTVGNWGKAAAAGVVYGAATGGSSSRTITVNGENYTELTFTSTGTLTVTKNGIFDFLIIGGGGGGASDQNGYGSGGGGGGGGAAIRDFTSKEVTSNLTVTIGAGGAGKNTYDGNSGGQTIVNFPLSSFTKVVGGYAGGGRAASNAGTTAEGSGGGGSSGFYNGNTAGAEGNNGGTASGGSNGNGAGGGGHGGVGGNSSAGGNGGAGTDISAWRGESANTTTVCGGGAGATNSGGIGTAGAGGGTGIGAAGLANRGAGGNAHYASNTGGNGGSGVVYVRFKI